MLGGHLEGDQICLHISETKSVEEWDGRSILNPELVLIPKFVVNSAGLGAPALAKRFTALQSSGVVPSAYYARGCYFTLSNTKVPAFKHLIYPIPEDGGIGVHVTLDLNGQIKFGPDVEWIDGTDDISSFLNKYIFKTSQYLFVTSFTLQMILNNVSLIFYHSITCFCQYHIIYDCVY